MTINKTPSIYRLLTLSILLATLSIIACGNNIVIADDTAVYLNPLALPAIQTRPNVVFVLDTSGSMGLPVDKIKHGNNSGGETTHYSPSTLYPGQTNYNGGAGDSHYYYLYTRQDQWSATPYIYSNKVHKSQMKCDVSTLNTTTPILSYDAFIYGTTTTAPWTGWSTMCPENSSSCRFVADASGTPQVDCLANTNVVTNTTLYPSPSLNISSSSQPNIIPDPVNGLFLVNYNFHNYLQGYYRYSVMQQGMKDLIDDSYAINLAIMRFGSNKFDSNSDGSYLIKESTPAIDPLHQAAIKNSVSSMTFNDGTPLTESLWEAVLYLRGQTALYGTSGPAAAFSNGTTYNSPIDYACQKSHIIILTDGTATSDADSDSSINSLPGYIGAACASVEGTSRNRNTVDLPSESCLDELAFWIHNDAGNTASKLRDHIADTTLAEDQTIKVHTLGFGLNTQLLISAAANGGGLNATASTAAQLKTALANLLKSIDFESDTSVTSAVAVNAYNRMQHREEVYFALFEPAASPRWNGNIKKYKLIDGVIKDANNNTAIDATTGYFGINAKSFWTTARDLDGDGRTDFSVDADDISVGGFATELTTPTKRIMYTYTGAAPVHSGVSAPSAIALKNEYLDLDSSNTFTDNANIAATPTLLGATVTTVAEAKTIIDWVRGGVADATSVGTVNPNPPGYFVGDTIHNPPAVITYATDTACLNAVPAPTDLSVCFDDTLYASTNLGTFHAIDADNGSELFSFVPRELLPNLSTYYKASGGFSSKVYGLDGAMSVWRNDVNDDGTINTGDHVYLYQPMRRGGTDLYALDVTDRNNPKLLWQIVGTGLDTSPGGDYQDLAQTWSTPQRTGINWCKSSVCSTRTVLLFGGGYDPVHDSATSSVSSSKGNAIYMVDAKTSELLWSAGDGSHHDFNNKQMTNSFAADITMGDIDGDGYVDCLFAMDIQGKLWRFDFDNDATTTLNASGVTGGIIAELDGAGAANFRHFFNAPDVAFFAPRGQPPYLTIAIASGHRADPREDVIDDRLYVLFDRNVLNAPTSYNYASSSSSTIDETDLSIAAAATSSAHGWYLPLSGRGEKGLSRTITFNGEILMTSYLPDSTSTTTCKRSTGEGRYYILNAMEGVTALTDSSGHSAPYLSLQHGGIPPEPALIFGSTDKCIQNCSDADLTNDVTEKHTEITACIGTECIDRDLKLPLHKTYWREN